MFSRIIKKISFIILFVCLFSFGAIFLPKGTQAMILREKSLRESFFSELIDEINLLPGQSLSQLIKLNYEDPLGIEILFRNPSEENVMGFFRLVDINKREIVTEGGFSLNAGAPADFYFFRFPEIEDSKGSDFWVEIYNQGTIPLIVGYYNQNVYHYGNLYLNNDLQPGNLQFQIHYQISPIQELKSNIVKYLQKGWLFFLVWLVIITSMTLMVIIFGKNYRIKEKKRNGSAQRKN